MGWYHEDWKLRTPLTIANHSGVAAPECTITIPPAMDKFWDNVLDNFNDIRITRADGVTLLDWAFDGTPSKANKSMTIQIDDTNHNVSTLYGNSNAAQSASVGVFLYYANTTENLASGWNNSINVTVNGLKTLQVDLSNPASAGSNYVIECSKPRPDQSFPNTRIRKQVNDDVLLYWDLSGSVNRLARRAETSLRDEEIAYVKCIIYDQDGADTTSAMTTLNDIRIGHNYVVSMPIRAGDHEKRYIIIMTFGLVNSAGTMRVIDQRATLLVNNLGLHTS